MLASRYILATCQTQQKRVAELYNLLTDLNVQTKCTKQGNTKDKTTGK